MKSFLLLALSFMGFYTIGFSQLEIQSQQTKKAGWQNTKLPTQCSFEVERGHAYRKLLPNETFLNKPLGELANEVPSNLCSFRLGIQTGIGKYFRFDSGLQWLQNGEAYQFISTTSDSTYAYVNRYRYLGMPLALSFQYGHSIRFFIGPGINPLIFNRFIQNQNWTTALGSKQDASVKIKNNQFNAAVLQAFIQIGVQFTAKSGWGISSKYIYRQQLINTHTKYYDYLHKPYAWGLEFGITKTLP